MPVPSHAEAIRGRSAGHGSFIMDARGAIVGFDTGMEALTGWSAVEVVGGGRDSSRLIGLASDEPGGERQGDPNVTQAALRSAGPATLDLRLTCRDGKVIEVEAMAVPDQAAADRITVSILRVLASGVPPGASPSEDGLDPLTGLPSRDAFAAALAAEVASSAKSGRPLGVILCDVDHLRKIGDRFGRGASDLVLRKLAGILRASVEPDDVVARLADDDFALLLPGMGRGSARQLAARLRSTVERFRFLAIESEAPGARVTLSLGAATYPADADNAADLIERAEEALGEARALGRNRVWCYTRRPRVPIETPVFLDGAEPSLLGYSTDLSPSGLFVTTPTAIDVGMRCALSFPLPTADGYVHVIGRIVRTVPAQAPSASVPGLGIEFERFGAEDRRAIEAFLYENEGASRRPENGRLSVAWSP